ncbi:GAP family protein [Plantibacter sp. YIM 135249]|uniref:GAP family protein n=1 Tax=Plantibacter sp. YIM 135249 TaxID=3423918 RepID=UPI003D351F07
MLDALGRVLPIAAAMAISSVPIMATVLILLSPTGRRSAVPFLVAWVLGMAIVLWVFLVLATIVPVRTVATSQPALGTALIAVGAGLLALSVIAGRSARRTRRNGGPSAVMPRWFSAMGSIGPLRAVGLALVMSVRPKALLLSAAAGLSVRDTRLTIGETAVLVAAYTIVAASSVALPIVYSLARPIRAASWLRAMRGWIEKNNAVVTVVILFVIGIVVVGDGISRL